MAASARHSGRSKSRVVNFFNDNFEILEAPPPIPANSTLASLAARYIR
jgi:hypothetical protein